MKGVSIAPGGLTGLVQVSEPPALQVKTEMPAEYETFLEVLTQFRSQNVNAEMVVTVVDLVQL